MLSLKDAEDIVLGSVPNSKIHKSAEIRNLYVFLMIIDDADEIFMDPFNSVDKETGEFRDFSILEGPPGTIAEKFKDVQ